MNPRNQKLSKAAYRRMHKSRISIRQKAYYQAHKEEVKARSRKYYYENRDTCVFRQKRYKYRHRDRYNELERLSRKLNPRAHKNRQLKYHFGITIDGYDKLFKLQGGVCAICRKASFARSRWGNAYKHLSIDHCHASGKVRGLLCQRCNRALGLFRDDIAMLRAAIRYLARNSEYLR